MDVKPCLSLIRKRFHSLTKVEQKVAEYILQNSSEIVSLSTSELADRIPVAKSAIVRCCQSLGFEGYTDLKLSLMTELSQQKSLNYTPYIHAQDQPDGILDKIFSSNIKTLQDTAVKLDRTMLQAVVKRLDAAEKIFIYGIGTSSSLAADFQYRLIQLGYNAFCFSDVPSMKVSTFNITPKDVAFGISNSGRTIATIDALNLASQNGAATVCLTSYPNSQILLSSDYPLVVYTDEIQYPVEALSSRIAQISVLDTIAISLSALHYEESFRRSVQTKKFVDTGRYPEKSSC